MSTQTNTGSVAFEWPVDALEANTGLDTVRERRIDLQQAMTRVEAQVARPSAATSWRAEVGAALIDLGEALDAHISEVEDEGGLLASIVADSPRLAGQVGEMEEQHAELRAGFDRALAACTSRDAMEPAAVRRRVTSLLGRLALHRQLGSELVFDAYNVDIGDGD